MIEPINNIKCFSAFQSAKHKSQKSEAPTKVKLASIIGAGICALGAAHMIARHQSKITPVNMFQIKYSEPEIMGVAVSSIVGGLAAGGLTDDKKYLPIKIKEGIHQTIANIITPLLLISGLNKIYDKFKIEKLPQFTPDNKFKKCANETIKMLPHLCIAILGLVGGVFLGTIISNKFNNIEKTPDERKVKALDFIYHPDDIAAACAIADKNGVLKKFVSKIIPPIFMLHGYESGTRR